MCCNRCQCCTFRSCCCGCNGTGSGGITTLPSFPALSGLSGLTGISSGSAAENTRWPVYISVPAFLWDTSEDTGSSSCGCSCR